jgi:anti-sigma regulatory factor (Ser/Thr protein kinase)
VIEVVVLGRWTRRLALDIYMSLRKCLAEHPSAIIVDLHHVKDPGAASAPMWLAANRAASSAQPPVGIALSLPAGKPLSQRLHWIGVGRVVPMFSTMDKARAAVINRRPLTQRLQLTRLQPERDADVAAQGLIDVACAAWSLPDLLHPSRLVISELVTNVVRHTGTAMDVTVRRRPGGLHLAVCDGNARLPRLRHDSGEAADPRGAGHGLQIVDALAMCWGAISTRDGKMVWATMRSHRPPQRR